MITVNILGMGRAIPVVTDASTWGEFKRQNTTINYTNKAVTMVDQDDNEHELSDSDRLPTDGEVTIILTPKKQKAG